MNRWLVAVILLVSIMATSACSASTKQELIAVKLMLDWVPNTNHTGIFVASEKGYFKEAGLDVQVVQPGEVYAEAAVASGAADFGISFQESLTLARAEGVPIVSIAAVNQHNTSGFASLTSLGVTGPADFEGLRYGSFGSPFESPTLEVLMESAGADFSKLKIIDIGYNDPLALIAQREIDLAWIFYGWQGFMARQQGVELNILMMEDYFDVIPDYYTPIVIASEDTVHGRPEVVRSFLKAMTEGYNFAIEKPDEAADILIAAVPELDSDLVRSSQKWLSGCYQADAPRWGEQKTGVWQKYIEWEVTHSILAGPIPAEDAFTNQFLP
ncbi:MAG: ABC transporter substrate-binding protein [Dehalococcoidales bacterium]|nr:ABC transporter substrate-binding protein [Dehalococcoidales bacterium]